MEYPGLQFKQDEHRLLGTLVPASERPPLETDALRSLVAAAGCDRWFPLEEAWAKLMEAYHAGHADLSLCLAERRDARFTLEVAPDALAAWVAMEPAWGGRAIHPDEIQTALANAGVSFGIDPQAVEAACRVTRPERVLVAAGQAAQNGEDTRFELLVADTRDRTPHVNAQGLIDFRDLGDIPLVVAGQPLMRRTPPTNGVAGWDIRGQAILPVPGRNEGFEGQLIGAAVASDDPNLLKAIVNGQPVRHGNGVMVEQVLTVRNVDVTSGNLNFDGTVNVEGEVLPGMKVHATGDIIVGGVVDAAELEAGGDIGIGGGIIAHAKVKAGGAVAARFVENAQVFAGTVITIDDMALQSDLQALRQIIVGAKAPERGRLSGGSARAMLLIKTPVLGAAAGGVTTILLGVNPELEARYQELLQRLAKQQQEEANLEKLVKHLSTQGDKGGMLEKVKATWQHAVQTWAAMLPEKDALEAQLALIAGARLEVGVGVAGAVDITFGRKLLRVRQGCDAGVFLVEGEHIVFGKPDAK